MKLKQDATKKERKRKENKIKLVPLHLDAYIFAGLQPLFLLLLLLQKDFYMLHANDLKVKQHLSLLRHPLVEKETYDTSSSFS